MSQYVPIHLPASRPESPRTLSERPASMSTASTIVRPFSPNPHSSPFTPNQTPTPPPSNPSETLPKSAFPTVLDPSLVLTARQIRSEFLRRDIMFARLIVTILASRIELGILSPRNGIGFPFTDKDERKVVSHFIWFNNRKPVGRQVGTSS